MKYLACAAAIFLIHTPAQAGGWAEPVYPPQPVCEPFLWWRVCDVENPSPRREREDKPAKMRDIGEPDAQERPAEPSRPAPDDTPADRDAPAPAPSVDDTPPEPPAAPDAPEGDAPAHDPVVDPPVNKEPPAKPKPPTKDKKPGHGYGDKNHDHQHKNNEGKT